MQIAYLNKGKIKAKSSTDEMLERAYSRDIRNCYVKHRAELTELGISETDFVARVKEKLRQKKGIYCQ